MVNNDNLYPLKFQPILKEKVWGGQKLSHLFQKEGEGNIGESWELSGVPENISVVANGALKDMSLNTLLEKHEAELVGKKVFSTFGTTFPLLFKFIDAREDLSVQLHPDDALAKKRHKGFGKTEMWYVMQAEKEARLILGFNRSMDESTYLQFLSEKKLPEILHSENVHEGDAFFIAPGTVHAIGAGVLLAEIQQTSDITYRIYDWDRPDTDGSFRELHTDLALKAINFKDTTSKITYSDKKNSAVLLKSIPYFETNKLLLTHSFQRNLRAIDSFVVYMCVAGDALFTTSNASEIVKRGESILIPACIQEITIETKGATFLEVYIP
ncbi:mannose-6-phosphate isomerase type 1 [Ulvibacter sp. MAR_2010_11]|uniref:type I phosphomannose isomerase catalytic subunit n=1 Tax=Ulvibacter sp. MAR_2010_11 TaxID=1250229 RepID=UPI000C2C98C0|nr:type I phosphomannose isomerase catalytic subunit [Ulvibacter sp. MAR_2010_11]PKA83679.1 mannose-6-phosphate isomerase type 1 [Ulvibacter sp. MAR_2010_11]